MHLFLNRRHFLLGAAALGAAFQSGIALAADKLALTDPLPTEVPKGTKLRIADQNQTNVTLLRLSGGLKELEKDGIEIEWQNFNGNNFVIEALRVGAADVGWGTDIATAFGRAQGAEIYNLAYTRNTKDYYGFYSKPASGITSVTQLKGKKIAYPKGTQMSAYILRVLDKAGLKPSDVQLINVAIPDVPDTLRAGEVDAAVIIAPLRSRFESDYKDKIHLLPEGVNQGTGLGPIYATRAALEDPAKAAAIARFARLWVIAQLYKDDHLDEYAQAVYVKLRNYDVATAKKLAQLEGKTEIPAFTPELSAELQKTVDFMASVNELPQGLKIADYFDNRFNAINQAARKEYAGI
ncbi:MAG: MetQ/NlpA family ABC transporter substrate-binding protein [Rhizobium sp.]